MCASHRLNPEKKRPGSTKLIYFEVQQWEKCIKNNIYKYKEGSGKRQEGASWRQGNAS